MPLTSPQFLTLAAQCAPAVASRTLMAVVQVESGFETLAIGVNGRRPMRLTPTSRAQALQTAQDLIAGGANIDLGLGQINSRNLAWLGLSLSDAFDPCLNLAASARILSADYRRSAAWSGDQQTALRMALSLYNTGDVRRGLLNGYVARVVGAANSATPDLWRRGPVAPARVSWAPGPPAWDVFAAPLVKISGFVFTLTAQGAER